MKKAIVTGANGFIGSNVIEELINSGIEIVALDFRFDKLPDDPHITKIIADLGNIDGLNISGDVFFHFAWASVVGAGRANPETQIDNLKLTLNCLELAKESACSRFIYASSVIEDEANIACKTPTIKPGAGYIYGSVKQMVAQVAQMTATKLGIDFISGKITNTYG
jgi:nucleoside-diphosphate-sugar epimerase